MARRPGGAICWLLQNRTSLAFSLAAGLVVAIVVLALGARNLSEQYQTVRQTGQVLAELDGVLSAVTDAETGQRGFLMTGDERYLAPYHTAFDSAASHLRALRGLTEGNTPQRRHVDALEPLVTDKLRELRDTVELGRERRADAAVQRLLTGRGLQLVEQIRSTVAAMKAEERQSQADQSTRYATQARRVLLALAALAALALGLLAVVFMTISPVRDVANAARDVTAREAAEESLRSSEATSRAFLESASESIVIADAAGRIVLVNARTETMFGYARAELIGQPVEVLIPAPLRERHVAHRATYMTAPRIRSMGRGLDLAGLKKDGTEFPVEVSLSYVETDEGTRAIAFVTDISERVAFQRAARQADKLAALGTLSAGIAHEINNPIGIISSRVEVMMLEAEEDGLPAEVRKDLEVILRHARRVATITQGLLSFARQSSGTRGPVNLNQVAEEIVQLVHKDMSRARVDVTTKLDEALPTIVADANAIGQVLLNLLTNARSAMPDGGEITVETSHLAAARSVRLTVRDTGSGIPPETLPKIFDPFFTTKSEGTGLGLAISHGIMHEHHGAVDVRSEVGKGSTFTLTFPLDATPGA